MIPSYTLSCNMEELDIFKNTLESMNIKYSESGGNIFLELKGVDFCILVGVLLNTLKK